jgi:hypothetical protein
MLASRCVGGARRAAYPNCQNWRLGSSLTSVRGGSAIGRQGRRPSKPVARDLWGWRD